MSSNFILIHVLWQNRMCISITNQISVSTTDDKWLYNKAIKILMGFLFFLSENPLGAYINRTLQLPYFFTLSFTIDLWPVFVILWLSFGTQYNTQENKTYHRVEHKPEFCLGNLDLPSKLPRISTLMLHLVIISPL